MPPSVAFVGAAAVAPASPLQHRARTAFTTPVSPPLRLPATPRRPRRRSATALSASPKPSQQAVPRARAPAPLDAALTALPAWPQAAALAAALLAPLRAARAQDADTASAAADAAAAAAADAAAAVSDLPESMRDTTTVSRVLVLVAFGLLVYATVGTLVLGVIRLLTRNSEEKEKQLVQDYLDGKDVPMGAWGPRPGDTYEFPPDFPYKRKPADTDANREMRRVSLKLDAKDRKKKAAEKRQAKGLAKEEQKKKKKKKA